MGIKQKMIPKANFLITKIIFKKRCIYETSLFISILSCFPIQQLSELIDLFNIKAS